VRSQRLQSWYLGCYCGRKGLSSPLIVPKAGVDQNALVRLLKVCDRGVITCLVSESQRLQIVGQPVRRYRIPEHQPPATYNQLSRDSGYARHRAEMAYSTVDRTCQPGIVNCASKAHTVGIYRVGRLAVVVQARHRFFSVRTIN